MPSVHAGLRYGYIPLVLIRFRLLVRMEEISVDLCPREKRGLSALFQKG